jgi:hypothetical protein
MRAVTLNTGAGLSRGTELVTSRHGSRELFTGEASYITRQYKYSTMDASGRERDTMQTRNTVQTQLRARVSGPMLPSRDGRRMAVGVEWQSFAVVARAAHVGTLHYPHRIPNQSHLLLGVSEIRYISFCALTYGRVDERSSAREEARIVPSPRSCTGTLLRHSQAPAAGSATGLDGDWSWRLSPRAIALTCAQFLSTREMR